MSMFACLLLAWSLTAPAYHYDAQRARQMAATVEIVRDRWGVPHVYGPSDASVVFGAMYARCEDEFLHIERAHLRMIGRAAEAYGEEYWPGDRMMHAFRIPTHARNEYRQLPDDVRALCDAATDAIHLYLETHPEVEPALLREWEPWYFLAMARGFHMGMLPRSVSVDFPSWRDPDDGSNMWALAGHRTASGKPILVQNPHIPLNQPYEMHLHSEGGLHVSGFVAYGGGITPWIAHNAHLGWSLTVNYPDYIDIYRETFDDPTRPLAYRYGDDYREAIAWTRTLKVRTDEGVEERELTFRRTHHGPIVALDEDGNPLAARIAQLQSGGLLTQWYRMAQAGTLAEFQNAIRPLALVFHNLAYADDAGNIYYVYNAAIPRRDPQFDWSKPVDGSDPRTEWQGLHPLHELPQVLNPPSGYVQNCNSTPYLTTEQANPRKSHFPPYMAPDGIDPRVPMVRARLQEREQFSFEEMQQLVFDTHVRSAARMIPRIVAEWEGLADSDPKRYERLEPLVEELQKWDQRAALDSVATTIYLLWVDKVLPVLQADAHHELFSTPVTEAKLTPPLLVVMRDLKKRHETWRVPWGEISIHRRAEPDFRSEQALPLVGGNTMSGMMFYVRSDPDRKRRRGVHGHSYVGVVEFSDPPRAATVIPFGQSRDPDSPHFEDQAHLFAVGKMKIAPFTREQVEASAMRRYRPGEVKQAGEQP